MVATLLSMGTSLHIEKYVLQTVLLWSILLITLVPRRNHAPALTASLLLWIMLLTPMLLTYVLTLPMFAIGYEAKMAARFFVLCQTPYCLLLARALHTLKRRWLWAPITGIMLVVGLQAGPVQAYYSGRYPKDEYVTLARTIQAYGREGEAIVLFNDSEWPLFHYAYEGTLPCSHIPYAAAGGEKLIAPYVEPAWKAHEGLWLVTIPQARQQDPEDAVRVWLHERGQVVIDERYGERRLLLYCKQPRDLAVNSEDGYVPQYQVDRTLAEGIMLLGYDQALREIRTGRNLRIVSIWRVDSARHPIDIRAGLIDQRGDKIGPVSEPVTLGIGDLLRARTDIPISARIPSGRYSVRLYVRGGGGVIIGTVDVGVVRVFRTMDSSSREAEHPTDYRFGEAIRLQGYDLERDEYRKGEQVTLTLYWFAEKKIGSEYVVFVHVLGEKPNPRTGDLLWGQVDSLPVQGKYPTSSWLQGDVIADRYLVPIDPKAPEGRYALEIGLYSPDTGERLLVSGTNEQALGDHVILGHISVY